MPKDLRPLEGPDPKAEAKRIQELCLGAGPRGGQGPTCSPVWLMAGISTHSSHGPGSPDGTPTSKPSCPAICPERCNWVLLCARKHGER